MQDQAEDQVEEQKEEEKEEEKEEKDLNFSELISIEKERVQLLKKEIIANLNKLIKFSVNFSLELQGGKSWLESYTNDAFLTINTDSLHIETTIPAIKLLNLAPSLDSFEETFTTPNTDLNISTFYNNKNEYVIQLVFGSPYKIQTSKKNQKKKKS